MDQQQSFRSTLVEWFKEIVPFNRLDTYTRKTREKLDNSPDADQFSNSVHYLICTEAHNYHISASPTYLGCIANCRKQLPGENWTRGNDLPDGKFCRETWDAIKDAIIRYELVKLEPLRELKAGVAEDFPPCTTNDNQKKLTEEYSEATANFQKSKDRLQRAERAFRGENKKDQELPDLRNGGDTA